jgi:hypothetical protein
VLATGTPEASIVGSFETSERAVRATAPWNSGVTSAQNTSAIVGYDRNDGTSACGCVTYRKSCPKSHRLQLLFSLPVFSPVLTPDFLPFDPISRGYVGVRTGQRRIGELPDAGARDLGDARSGA